MRQIHVVHTEQLIAALQFGTQIRWTASQDERHINTLTILAADYIEAQALRSLLYGDGAWFSVSEWNILGTRSYWRIYKEEGSAVRSSLVLLTWWYPLCSRHAVYPVARPPEHLSMHISIPVLKGAAMVFFLFIFQIRFVFFFFIFEKKTSTTRVSRLHTQTQTKTWK